MPRIFQKDAKWANPESSLFRICSGYWQRHHSLQKIVVKDYCYAGHPDQNFYVPYRIPEVRCKTIGAPIKADSGKEVLNTVGEAPWGGSGMTAVTIKDVNQSNSVIHVTDTVLTPN